MTKPPLQNIFSVFAVFVIALALTLQAFFVPSVSAAQITNRKLTLQAGATDGGAKPGGTVNHLYEFTLPTSGIRSIKFEYCTTAANSLALPNCVAPTGVSVAGASLGSELGHTGFTFTNMTGTTDPNDFYLTRASTTTGGSTAVTYRIDNVVNPSTEGTFFVRINTYATADATGGETDSGTVAASTSEDIVLSGTMPESLIFCAGAFIDKVGGVPDCSTATPGTITFNQLFSPTDTASAVSKMAASTNAGQGYVITVNGPTLTSGSNTIAGLTTPNASVKGVPQFGLNLRANTAAAAPGFPGTGPLASADIDLTSTGTGLKGQPTADYNTPDTFKFVSGNPVANSAFDGSANTTLGPTDAQIYTVSYIANVPGSQPAGTYTSTLTYICTPTF
jgi:hypothetical protein